MTRDEAISKIRKLLRLAEGTTNEHEAALALARAQALQAAHEIEQAVLSATGDAEDHDANEPVEEGMIWQRPKSRDKVAGWRGSLIGVLAHANHCTCFFSGNGVKAVGAPSDLARVRMLYEACVAEVLRLRSAWQKNERAHGRSGGARGSFGLGCVAAINEAIRAERRRVEEEARLKYGPERSGRALVLVGERDARVARYMAERYPRMGQGRASRARGAAFAAGRAAGSDIYGRSTRPRLGGGRTRIGS